MSTQTIGLFEAKTHLSELVARAEQGEEVVITRHNRPVAKIVPMGPVVAFDANERRKAIADLHTLRETLRRKHGTMSSQEIIDLVREGREERDAQILDAALRRPE